MLNLAEMPVGKLSGGEQQRLLIAQALLTDPRILFLFLYKGYAEQAYSILFGTILGISISDVWITVIFSIGAFAALLFLFRPLLFASFDPEVAQARGIHIKLLSVLFLIIVAITVSIDVQVVGVLLIFTLLIAPAATAQHISNRPVVSIVLSIGLGLGFMWGGMLLGLLFHVPVSFFIAGLASLTYLLSVPFLHSVSPHFYHQLPHED